MKQLNALCRPSAFILKRIRVSRWHWLSNWRTISFWQKMGFSQNLRGQIYDSKWRFLDRVGTLCGSTVHSSVRGGLIFQYSNMTSYKFLNQIKRVLTDDGYPHHRCLRSGNVTPSLHSLQATKRACRDTLNRRLKKFFKVLKSIFCHNVSMHARCLYAAVQICQPLISTSDPLFGQY